MSNYMQWLMIEKLIRDKSGFFDLILPDEFVDLNPINFFKLAGKV